MDRTGRRIVGHALKGATMEARTRLTAAAVAVVAVLAVAGPGLAQLAGTVDTPRGERPEATPTVEILAPTAAGNRGQGATARLRAGDPLVVRTAFTDLAFRPDLVTEPPEDTLATVPQNVVDGRVEGHIHIYATEVGSDDNRADPFCIYELEHRIEGEPGEFAGVAERECGTLTPGVWQILVDVNTNAHDSVLKAHPRDLPASDAVRVVVTGQPGNRTAGQPGS